VTQQILSKAGDVKASTGGGGGAPTDHVSAAAAAEQRHAIAVAVATAAAAEVATAQAAVEVARLTRPSYHTRERSAAIVIQTAFRGYLVIITSTVYIGVDAKKNCSFLNSKY
jgi:hypothetical protein